MYQKEIQNNNKIDTTFVIEEAFQTKEKSLKDENISSRKENTRKNKKQFIIKIKLKSSIKLALIIISISLILIASIYLFYTKYYNNPKVIINNSLNALKKNVDQAINLNDTFTLVGDNFSLYSNLKTNLASDKYKKEIMNCNNANITYSIKQDLKNQKFFYNKKMQLNNKNIIDDKFLIENSTEYYFINNFLSTYVNNGSNNYFETINKDRDFHNNIRYLNNIITRSLAKNINEDYYKLTDTKTYIKGENKKARKVSIELNNAKIISILNNSISDLKKDTKAFNILNSYIKDFDNFKISTNFLKKGQTLTINFFTTSLLNTPQKYEFIISDTKNSKSLLYESGINSITYLENNHVKFYINYELENKNITLNIKDDKKKNLGIIELTNADKAKSLIIDYSNEDYKIYFKLKEKIENLTNDSYNSKINITVDLKDTVTNILSGTINIDSKITRNVKINEEIDDIILSSSLSNEKKIALKNYLKTRLKKDFS